MIMEKQGYFFCNHTVNKYTYLFLMYKIILFSLMLKTLVVLISLPFVNTVEQVKFACAIISRIRELVSHART